MEVPRRSVLLEAGRTSMPVRPLISGSRWLAGTSIVGAVPGRPTAAVIRCRGGSSHLELLVAKAEVTGGLRAAARSSEAEASVRSRPAVDGRPVRSQPATDGRPAQKRPPELGVSCNSSMEEAC